MSAKAMHKSQDSSLRTELEGYVGTPKEWQKAQEDEKRTGIIVTDADFETRLKDIITLKLWSKKGEMYCASGPKGALYITPRRISTALR